MSTSKFYLSPPGRPLKSGLVLATLLTLGLILPSQAQKNPGDIIVVGNSPSQWAQNQQYWNQLLGIFGSAVPAAVSQVETTAPDNPQLLAQKILQNIQVSQPQLQPIIKLPGSSQVMGSVTNRNKEPVTISGVNFVVLDRSGNVIQTGSAVPEPATVGPGQTVTYQQTLLTVPFDIGATVRLGNPAVSVQGGV